MVWIEKLEEKNGKANVISETLNPYRHFQLLHYNPHHYERDAIVNGGVLGSDSEGQT